MRWSLVTGFDSVREWWAIFWDNIRESRRLGGLGLFFVAIPISISISISISIWIWILLPSMSYEGLESCVGQVMAGRQWGTSNVEL